VAMIATRKAIHDVEPSLAGGVSS